MPRGIIPVGNQTPENSLSGPGLLVWGGGGRVWKALFLPSVAVTSPRALPRASWAGGEIWVSGTLRGWQVVSGTPSFRNPRPWLNVSYKAPPSAVRRWHFEAASRRFLQGVGQSQECGQGAP